MGETDFKEAAVHQQVIIQNTLNALFFKTYTLLALYRNKLEYFAHRLRNLKKQCIIIIIIIIITKTLGFSCTDNLKLFHQYVRDQKYGT